MAGSAAFATPVAPASSPKRAISEAFRASGTGRGALLADFNPDGKLDILQIDRRSNVALFRNLGHKADDGPPLPSGNWTEIRLVEPNPNCDAVGARISVKTGVRVQTRTIEVGGGSSRAPQSETASTPRFARARRYRRREEVRIGLG